MNSNATINGKSWIGILLAVMAFGAVAEVSAQPDFSKSFDPDPIGPGSTTTLTFTITNADTVPVTDLAFTDVLPGTMAIAGAANVTNTCGGTVTAPNNGGTISFSGGSLGASTTCTITVDVTSTATETNLSGDLTSSAGNSGGATAILTVDPTLPGFSKSFSPASIPLGSKSTLTFTIDNSLNGALVHLLGFTDNLPVGMEIADPAAISISTDCTGLTAVAGTSTISLSAGNLLGGATCFATVDVVGTGVGLLGNTSGELTLRDPARSSGKASATLEVTVTPIALSKSFTDDPVPPGETVTLDFIISNLDRDFPATNIAFIDDLALVLPGMPDLVFLGVLSNDCGGAFDLGPPSHIGFSLGTLAPETSCTISVSVDVPAGASPGIFTNTTSVITATIDGEGVTGNVAEDDLFIMAIPRLTKEFLDATTGAPDPVVNAGDDVIIRFTIENTSATSSATGIAFLDELTDGTTGDPPDPTSGFLPFPVSVVLPAMPCGIGSSILLVDLDVDREALRLFDGNLAPAPGAGSTCTFDVLVTIPVGFPPGIYVNTTEEITATVDGMTVTGDPASDDLTVVAAPSLTKTFTDDPVAPGGTVTLEYTLTYSPDASGDATDITFTDDLVPTLAGLTANLPPTPNPPCGVGSSLTGSAGDTFLTFASGTLMPGESCTFSVTLDVPAGAASGSHTNTTSVVSATVEGATVTSAPATDDLKVAGLTFTKEFIGDPVIPGETVTLRFTIENVHPTDNATITSFTDNLAADLTGLAATGGPSVNTCGGTLSGTTNLTYSGGSLTSGSTCTIEVELLVPPGAADGTYANITSALDATQGGVVIIDPARDDLTVSSNLLQLTKAFTDDPVAPGGTVNLRFTLTNLNAGQAASDIAFTDDLALVLPGTSDLTVDTPLSTGTCTGSLVATIGDTFLTYSGGTLGAGNSCSFDVSVNVPGDAALNIYTNTTSGVTGMIGGFAASGDAASDDLAVVDLLAFSKSFDGPTTVGGTLVLTFTITNPGGNAVSGLAFSDNLDDVIIGLEATSLPTDPCGPGSTLSGTSFLILAGGNLGPGETCTIPVDLLVPATATVGTFPNTTSALFRAGLPVANPATADLVVEPPPTFAKSFSPASIGLGLNSTLTFTIDNSASALAASSLDFTDNLPSGVQVADPTTVTDTCGGTLTAGAGTSTISYTGGTVGGGGVCTLAVEVTSTAVGTHINTTSDLMSSSGNSGTATDNLTVNPTIIIVKQATPEDDTAFEFAETITGGMFTLTDPSDNTEVFASIDPGSYEVTEILPSGWTLESIVCTGDTDGGSVVDLVNNMVTIDLDPGEGITCTFTDQGRGTINIVKEALPEDDTVFDFDETITPGAFTLMDPSDDTETFTGVAAGSYEVAETLPLGWTLGSIVCTGDTDGGSVVDLPNGKVTIDLDPGEDITCTFSNDGRGLITIVKQAAPEDDTAFEFTETITGGGMFTLTDPSDNTEVFASIDPGSYEVTEILPSDWTLESIVCTGDTDGGSVVNLNNNTVTIDLDEGEQIVCTFTDQGRGIINIVKEALPADDTAFDFDETSTARSFTLMDPSDDTKTFAGVAAGSYEVIETLPLGWTLGSIVCTGDTDGGSVVDLPNSKVTIDLDPGEDITCTFFNDGPSDYLATKRATFDDPDGDMAANPGDGIAYEVIITNTGGTSLNTTFTDTVDGNTTLDCTTNPPTTDVGSVDSCDEVAGTLVVDLGEVANGTTATITFRVVIDNPFTGGVDEVSNQGTVSGSNITETLTDDPDNLGGPGQENPTTTSVNAIPDLRATKRAELVDDQDGDGLVDPGDTIAYTVVLRNAGGMAGTGVVFTDTPGVNTTLVAGSVTTSQGTVSSSSGDVEINVGVLPAGGEVTITFRVTVDRPFLGNATQVENQGLVVGENIPNTPTDDPDTPDPADPTVTTIDLSADLRLQKTASTTAPDLNTEVDFTLLLTNDGPADAVVEVTDALPEGLAFVRADPADDYDSQTGLWTVGALAPETSASLTITARVETTEPRTNTAEVTASSRPDPDSVPGDSAGDDYSGVTVTGVIPVIEVDPASVNYGEVATDRFADESVTVRNIGEVDLEITSLALTGDGAGFSLISGAEAGALPVGTAREIVVRFAPSSGGVQRNTLEIVSSAQTRRVQLRGLGLLVAYLLDPTSLDFGSLLVDSTQVDSVEVTNTGDVDLDIANVRFRGDAAEDFSVVRGGEDGTLPSGASRFIVVRFVPSSRGTKSAQLTFDIRDDALVVSLEGEGLAAEIVVDPEALDLGDVLPGESVESMVQVTNAGNLGLEITSLGLAGGVSSPFSLVSGEAGPLPGGALLDIVVRFAPVVQGEYLDSLRILSTAGDVTVRFQGIGRLPDLDVTLPPGSAMVGQEVEVDVATTGSFSPTESQLFYRRGGEQTYQQGALRAQAGLLAKTGAFTGVIPGDFVTERGVDYYVRLSDGRNTVTFPEAHPQENPAHLRVRVAQLASQAVIAPEVFHMVSVPLVLDDGEVTRVLADNYGPYAIDRWRLFRWQNSGGAYAEFPNLDSTFTPGTAFWLITADGGSFDVQDGLSVDASGPYTLTIPPGWSQLSTPFPFAIAWDSVAASGGVQAPVAYDGSEYTYDQPVLQPWEGYFVFNEGQTPVTLVFSPVEAATAMGKHEASMLPSSFGAYTLRLVAELPDYGLRDSQNILGLATEAANGWDGLDRAEAPPIGDHVRLSIVEGDQRFAANFKSLQGEGQKWDVEVTAVVESEVVALRKHVRVRLVEQGPRPEGFQRYVLDLDYGTPVPLDTNTFVMTLSTEEPVRHLQVIVGTKAFAEQHNDEVPLTPLADVLEQNYPNPFNPETVLAYQLSRRSRVVLEVYDGLGRRVRTLVDAEQLTGRHEVVWDGRDDGGHALASGMYFYRLQAGSFNATRAMTLLR